MTQKLFFKTAISKTIATLLLTVPAIGMMTEANATSSIMAANGAPSCASCHTGGAYSKIEGRNGLAAYLAAKVTTPATTPTTTTASNNAKHGDDDHDGHDDGDDHDGHDSDKDDKNKSNHVESTGVNHVESTGVNHVESTGVNPVENNHVAEPRHSISGDTNKIKSYLTAVSEPLAQGEVKLKQKTSKTEFSAEIKFPVPSAALDVANVVTATDATLNLVMRDSTGADYAECSLDLSKTKKVTNRKATTLIAEYQVKITDRKGFLQANAGVCDIDLTTAGIQSGVPVIQAGDTAEVTIDTNNAVVVSGGF